MEGGKLIMGSKIIVNQQNFGFGMKRKSSFTLSSLQLSYMDVKFGVAVYLDNLGERYSISKKNFITYNLKIKGNTPYPILLIKESVSPIESIAMIIYLTYKNNINNKDDKMLPKIASNSSQKPPVAQAGMA
jgi:hypothetical protein